MLVVNYAELWKYCYVNCIKKFLLPMLSEGNYYILGNLNPIIDIELIESEPHYWKDLFTICSILKNTHRIDSMDVSNRKDNMLTKRFMINDYVKRSTEDLKGKFNFYKSFLDYIESGNEKSKEEVYNCVTEYFEKLIAKCLIS